MPFSLSKEWSTLKEDLGRTKWKWIFFGFAVTIWLVGLVMLLWDLGLSTTNKEYLTTACTPDGEFRLDPYSYDYWDGSAIFQITLAFGDFTFSEAKSIDIAWDVVIGRGGQALLAMCSWRVFALYVTTSMETTPVTYNSFEAIFIQLGPSILSVGGVIWDFTLRKGLHSKIAMIFIIMTMAFILSFSTLASAMTGYTGFVISYVPEPQTIKPIRFDQLRPVAYIIYDGTRVNQNETFFVTDEKVSGDPYLGNDGYCFSAPISRTPECLMLVEAADYFDYLQKPSYYSRNNTFMGIDLGEQPLNITALSYNRRSIDKGTLWRTSTNETYDYEYLTNRGICLATVNYQWGFSFLQLYFMLIMLLLWSIGIMVMAMRARFTMHKRGLAEAASKHKAVIQLAAAMQKQMGNPDMNLEFIENENLEKCVKDVQGGAISYTSPITTTTHSLRNELRRFKGWLWREKWWLSVTITCLSLLIHSWKIQRLNVGTGSFDRNWDKG